LLRRIPPKSSLRYPGPFFDSNSGPSPTRPRYFFLPRATPAFLLDCLRTKPRIVARGTLWPCPQRPPRDLGLSRKPEQLNRGPFSFPRGLDPCSPPVGTARSPLKANVLTNSDLVSYNKLGFTFSQTRLYQLFGLRRFERISLVDNWRPRVTLNFLDSQVEVSEFKFPLLSRPTILMLKEKPLVI